MKKHIYSALFAIGVVLLASCGGNSKKEGKANADACAQPSLRLESYSYDCVGEFEDADSTATDASRYVRFKGTGVLPMADGEAGVSALRDSLLKLADVRFNEADEPVPVPVEGVKLTEKSVEESEAGSEVLSDLSVALVNPQVAVFEQTSYKYQAGAAHGNTSKSYVNYSVTDGKILGLADIFAPAKNAELQKMIVAKLKAENVPLLVKDNEIEVSPQFEITNCGVSFSYDPYLIAPYSSGVVRADFTSAELQKAGVLTPAAAKILMLPQK